MVPSPRHADILLFTGAVTRAMRSPALRAWQSAPDPKICISYGACGNSGGIFHDLYCVWGGTDKIVPVDVYIPGCPPTPAATLYGFAMALGLLEQKIHARQPGELDDQPTELLHPNMVQRCGCVSIAKRAVWPAIAMAARSPTTICVYWGRAITRYCAGWKRRKIRV